MLRHVRQYILMNHLPHRRTRLLATLVALLLGALVAGCGVAAKTTPTPTLGPPSTPVSSPAAVATIAGTPAPDRAALLKDGGIAIIRTAFDRLMDEYIEPLKSSRLLDAGWTILTQEADKQSLSHLSMILRCTRGMTSH